MKKMQFQYCNENKDASKCNFGGIYSVIYVFSCTKPLFFIALGIQWSIVEVYALKDMQYYPGKINHILSWYVIEEEKNNFPLRGKLSLQGKMFLNRHSLGNNSNHTACRLHGKGVLLMGFRSLTFGPAVCFLRRESVSLRSLWEV